jgi:hypothetical protein
MGVNEEAMMTMIRVAALLTVIGWALAASQFDVGAVQDSGLGCGDFLTQQAAQAQLDMDPSDPFGLDTNENGIACDEPGAQVASERDGADDTEAADDAASTPPVAETEATNVSPASSGALPAPPEPRQDHPADPSSLDGALAEPSVWDRTVAIFLGAYHRACGAIPDVDVGTVWARTKATGREVQEQVIAALPEVDVDLPHVDVGLPHVEVGLPDVEVPACG